MSFDLFFYKKKGSDVTDSDIAEYLTENLASPNDEETQWFFESDDTDVYFSIETNEPEDDPEMMTAFDDFEDTHFSFNLNFMRPEFFGLEAFPFVEKFIKDLNLYVLNPQTDSEIPYIPTKEELFANWNKTNLAVSKDHFDAETSYYPPEKSNEIWQYNFNRESLQEETGYDYHVSRIYFCKRADNDNIVTMSVWVEHNPHILPETDYYLLVRKYKKLFKTVEDQVLITRQTLLDKLGNYFEDHSYPGCKIIHPDKAAKAGDIFNGIKSDIEFGEFMSRVAIEKLFNAKP